MKTLPTFLTLKSIICISSYVSGGWENLQKCKVLSISYIFLGNEFETKSIDQTQTIEI